MDNCDETKATQMSNYMEDRVLRLTEDWVTPESWKNPTSADAQFINDVLVGEGNSTPEEAMRLFAFYIDDYMGTFRQAYVSAKMDRQANFEPVFLAHIQDHPRNDRKHRGKGKTYPNTVDDNMIEFQVETVISTFHDKADDVAGIRDRVKAEIQEHFITFMESKRRAEPTNQDHVASPPALAKITIEDLGHFLNSGENRQSKRMKSSHPAVTPDPAKVLTAKSNSGENKLASRRSLFSNSEKHRSRTGASSSSQNKSNGSRLTASKNASEGSSYPQPHPDSWTDVMSRPGAVFHYEGLFNNDNSRRHIEEDEWAKELDGRLSSCGLRSRPTFEQSYGPSHGNPGTMMEEPIHTDSVAAAKLACRALGVNTGGELERNEQTSGMTLFECLRQLKPNPTIKSRNGNIQLIDLIGGNCPTRAPVHHKYIAVCKLEYASIKPFYVIYHPPSGTMFPCKKGGYVLFGKRTRKNVDLINEQYPYKALLALSNLLFYNPGNRNNKQGIAPSDVKIFFLWKTSFLDQFPALVERPAWVLDGPIPHERTKTDEPESAKTKTKDPEVVYILCSDEEEDDS